MENSRYRAVVEDKYWPLVEGCPGVVPLSEWRSIWGQYAPVYLKVLHPSIRFYCELFGAAKHARSLCLDFQSVKVKCAVLLMSLFFPERVFRLINFRRCKDQGFLGFGIYFLFQRFLMFSIPRVVDRAMVLSKWEVKHYNSLFDLADQQIFTYVPWPIYSEARDALGLAREGVIVSGITSTDYLTAINGLKTISGAVSIIGCQEEKRMRIIVPEFSGRFINKMEKESYLNLLSTGAVHVVSLIDDNCSCGLTRIRDSIECGIPLVITRVKGVEEYLEDGVSCLFFEPGDYAALSNCVESLLRDSSLRHKLVQGLAARSVLFTEEKFRCSIREFIMSENIH